MWCFYSMGRQPKYKIILDNVRSDCLFSIMWLLEGVEPVTGLGVVAGMGLGGYSAHVKAPRQG